ncbi:hypothetical protein [Roseovarius albus]|uniref:hypothetical protein n=1 Tax=Roseovarius albus TaxID=1247867 RepID=UPI0013564B33|nr:hypothetical protein [Roseovarius albus]
MNWLMDGIREEMIAGLSLFRELRTISHLTSFDLQDFRSAALSDRAHAFAER